MDGVGSYVTVTLALFAIAGMMIVIRNWRNAVVSNDRMYRMMLACGFDETTARDASRVLDIDMQAVQKRCRACPAPDTCDRWLNGEAVPSNDFCPNATCFMAALETSQYRVKYDQAKRPGRRLDG